MSLNHLFVLCVWVMRNGNGEYSGSVEKTVQIPIKDIHIGWMASQLVKTKRKTVTVVPMLFLTSHMVSELAAS